ncbi:MAG TPA: hypothetical protein VFJ22_08435 [Dermatophilaceae bacterium]|nr:hypothetical protein [Dermatophilaceae bacterium]
MDLIRYAVRPAVRKGFRILAAGRRAKAFHPVGVTVEGTAWPLHNEVLTLLGEPVPVTGRFSKGVGLPGDLPDVLGIALRFGAGEAAAVAFGAGEAAAVAFDTLLSSAGEGRFTRCLPLASGSWSDAWLTTIQPYGEGRRRIWLAAQVTPGAVPLRSNSLQQLRTRLAAASLTVLLSASDGGPWTPVAHLELRLGGSPTRFDPILNPPPGLSLQPDWLTSVREAAYLGSRRGAPAHRLSA